MGKCLLRLFFLLSLTDLTGGLTPNDTVVAAQGTKTDRNPIFLARWMGKEGFHELKSVEEYLAFFLLSSLWS